MKHRRRTYHRALLFGAPFVVGLIVVIGWSVLSHGLVGFAGWKKTTGFGILSFAEGSIVHEAWINDKVFTFTLDQDHIIQAAANAEPLYRFQAIEAVKTFLIQQGAVPADHEFSARWSGPVCTKVEPKLKASVMVVGVAAEAWGLDGSFEGIMDYSSRFIPVYPDGTIPLTGTRDTADLKGNEKKRSIVYKSLRKKLTCE